MRRKYRKYREKVVNENKEWRVSAMRKLKTNWDE